MKKLIFILMVSSLFTQSEDASIYDKLYLLNGETYTGQFISSDGQLIIFKPTGYPSGQSIKKSTINRVMLSDGTIVYKYSKEDDNSIYTREILTSAGNKLVQFRSDYYMGFLISTLGYIVLVYGTTNDMDMDIMKVGGGVSFVGSIIMLLSFNHVGEAGEDLIDAGEKLETEE